MDGREQRNPPNDTAKFQEAAPATSAVRLKEKTHTNLEDRYNPCNVSIGLVTVIPGLFSTCV